MDKISEKVFLSGIILIHLIALLVLFYGFYPGGMCRDTVLIIRCGITAEYTSLHPFTLQVLAALGYSIFPNQSPLLFLQLGGYLLGIFFLSYYFFKIDKRWLAILIILVLWFPYNIFLQAMVVKDVALMVVWLNIFALSVNSMAIKSQQFRLIVLMVNITLLLLGVLIRYNSFTATPALLFLILYGYDQELLKARSCMTKTALAVCSLLMAFFFMKGVNGIFLFNIKENRNYTKSYLVEQVCTYDLIGMSIMDDHNGITSVLSRKDQHRISYLYNTLPIYWLTDIDETLFERELDIFTKWKEMVIHDPLLYMRHRLHIFIKTFGSNDISQLMWVRQAQAGLVKDTLLSDKIPSDKFTTPEWHKKNIVYSTIRSYLEGYFKFISSAIPFALLGLMMLLHSIYILFFKKRHVPIIKIICLVNLVALLYYMPYLFFIHQAETRYVYPSIVLIIFTMPFYIDYFVYGQDGE